LGEFAAPGLAEGTEAVVAIRPQGIHPRASGEGIPGRLEFRRFLGEIELLEIAVDGLPVPLKARARAGVAISLKSELVVEVDAAEVLVFAAPDA
jgi:iron(III) transport system ATP-binding protein